jgi:hypothetical protein
MSGRAPRQIGQGRTAATQSVPDVSRQVVTPYSISTCHFLLEYGRNVRSIGWFQRSRPRGGTGMVAVNVWDVVRVPFDAIRFAYKEFRKALFTASRPSGEHFVVDASVTEVERALGEQSYAPNWEFSYYERGEVLNLARVVYERGEAGGETRVWWQTHVRGWRTDEDGLALHAHWELEPTENANAHLDGEGFSADRGMENLRSALDDAGLDYTSKPIDPADANN